MNERERKTWREVCSAMTWPEFRDWVLDQNPLETVNMPEWKNLWQECQENSDD